jgi:hypothetical protein
MSAEGRSCGELANRRFDFGGRSVGGDFDGGGRDAGPVLEFRLIEIDAAVFSGAGLQHSGGSELNRLALESKSKGWRLG